MLQKTVNICGKDVNFRSSASVPRLYRAKFGRDIFKDLSKLEKAYKEKGGEEGDRGSGNLRECRLYHGLPCRSDHPEDNR